MISKQNNVQVFRITAARKGLNEDVRGRQRRYVIAMSVRTVSVILAATLWNVERPVALVALVLGIGLPYIAVVIANGGREKAPAPQASFVPALPSRDRSAAVRGFCGVGPRRRGRRGHGHRDGHDLATRTG
ncbi:DUF3099 domain-containing protein [Streptomyces sp. NPDC006476]|uniref:DUF3099 domain-containing protein n=1 Tax=Streptomyces sp. NPDC006476 TaxID=3157175 RepID=UPI0033ACE101